MQYSLKFTIIEPTDALKAAVDSKMQHIEPRVQRFGDAVSAEVEIGKTTQHHHKGELYRAEIRLQIPGNNMYAEALHEDLYAAIGDAADNILRQIGDLKESIEDQKHLPRPDKE
jgi:putative sigma-54 modulation protein